MLRKILASSLMLVLVVAALPVMVASSNPVQGRFPDADELTIVDSSVTAEIWVNHGEIECGERTEFVTVLTVDNPGSPIPGVYVSLSTPTHPGNSRVVAAPEAAEIHNYWVDWDNITLPTGVSNFVVVTETDVCVPLYDWGGSAQASLVRREPWQILAQAWAPQTRVIHTPGHCGFDWGVEVEARHIGSKVEAVLTVENQFGIDTAIWLLVSWGSLTPSELPEGWLLVDDDSAWGWTPRIEDGGTVEIPIVFEIEDDWFWWVIVAEGEVRTIPGAAWGWTDAAMTREMREMTNKDFMAMYEVLCDRPHLQTAVAMVKQRLVAIEQAQKHLLHVKEVTK